MSKLTRGNRMISRIGLVLCIALCCSSAGAQEAHLDRTRQFAALPNWTGIWEGEIATQLRSDAFGKAFEKAMAHPENIPTVAPPGALDPQEAFAVSRTQLAQQPPYTAEWQRKYKERERQIRATPLSAVKPGSIMACDWDFPELMDNPFDTLFQIYVTPEETLLLFVNGQARHIYTDRSHPSPDDLWPSALGNSVGHWEAQTLLVDTIEHRGGPFIRVPHVLSPDLSEHARFSERIRMVDPDTLEDDMTIEDAERLTRPWTLTLKFHRVKDLDRLIPTNCTENNRFRVIEGHLTIVPR